MTKINDSTILLDAELDMLHEELAVVYRTNPRATVLINSYWREIDAREEEKAYFEGLGTYVSDHGN